MHLVADRLDAHSPSAEKVIVCHTVQTGDAAVDLVE